VSHPDMTTNPNAGAIAAITKDDLEKRSKALSIPRDVFNSSDTLPIIYIRADSRDERTYAFHDCTRILFQGEDGGMIWSTHGEMEITLPAKVSVKIQYGKAREILTDGRTREISAEGGIK
jgi:hypothetical protein